LRWSCRRKKGTRREKRWAKRGLAKGDRVEVRYGGGTGGTNRAKLWEGGEWKEPLERSREGSRDSLKNAESVLPTRGGMEIKKIESACIRGGSRQHIISI